MNRKVLTGIGVSLLVLASLALVAGVAAHDGHDGRDRATRELVIDDDAVRTVVIDDGWRGGPGFGFLVFPLVIGGLVLLFAARRGRSGPPWRGHDDELRAWHRRVHAEEPALTTPAPPPVPSAPPAPPAGPSDAPGA